MNKLKGNYVIIDTETGGLSPKNNSLLSFAMVCIKDGELVGQYEWFIKHDTYKVNPYALKVNKIDLVQHDNIASSIESTQHDVKSVLQRIYGNSSKPSVIGHNVSFDLGFIHEQLMPKQEWENYCSYRNIDTAGISRFLIDCGVINIKKADLSSLLNYFNMGSEESVGRHTALFDAIKTWDVYNKLVELMEVEG